mgnify:CR=1 FL=1|jgi:hypothetical protein
MIHIHIDVYTFMKNKGITTDQNYKRLEYKFLYQTLGF